MGRQFGFFMNEADTRAFISYVMQDSFVLQEGTTFSPEFITSTTQIKEDWNTLLFSKEEIDKLKTEHIHGISCDFMIINSIDSPVIEFARTNVLYDKKKIMEGRIWIELKYFRNTQLEEKAEYLLPWYNQLVRWIKKNVHCEEMLQGGKRKKVYISKSLVKLMKEDGFCAEGYLELLHDKECEKTPIK